MLFLVYVIITVEQQKRIDKQREIINERYVKRAILFKIS